MTEEANRLERSGQVCRRARDRPDCPPMSLLDSLARTPDELEALVAAFPAGGLRWTPPDWAECPSETFSAIGHVCHMRDIERDGYHVRLDRTMREELPDLVSLDGYALERERRYADQPLAQALAAFRAARAETLRRVRGWAPADGQRVAIFGAFGRVTATGLLHVLQSHDRQHLAGLHYLLARGAT